MISTGTTHGNYHRGQVQYVISILIIAFEEDLGDRSR